MNGNKIDSLTQSELTGMQFAERGTIQRSDDPFEQRWLWYYEPDDEQWNAFEYGHSIGMQKLREQSKAGMS